MQSRAVRSVVVFFKAYHTIPWDSFSSATGFVTQQREFNFAKILKLLHTHMVTVNLFEPSLPFCMSVLHHCVVKQMSERTFCEKQLKGQKKINLQCKKTTKSTWSSSWCACLCSRFDFPDNMACEWNSFQQPHLKWANPSSPWSWVNFCWEALLPVIH